MKKLLSISLASSLALAGLTSCQKDENGVPSTPVVIKDYSVNPSLVTTLSGFDAVKINTLISSDDKLTDSPNFVFGAQPDGAGLMKNPSGEGFILINNHEIIRSVSRVYLDKTLKPTKGEYILDGDGGTWRLCSATLATLLINNKANTLSMVTMPADK